MGSTDPTRRAATACGPAASQGLRRRQGLSPSRLFPAEGILVSRLRAGMRSTPRSTSRHAQPQSHGTDRERPGCWLARGCFQGDRRRAAKAKGGPEHAGPSRPMVSPGSPESVARARGRWAIVGSHVAASRSQAGWWRVVQRATAGTCARPPPEVSSAPGQRKAAAEAGSKAPAEAPAGAPGAAPAEALAATGAPAGAPSEALPGAAGAPAGAPAEAEALAEDLAIAAAEAQGGAEGNAAPGAGESQPQV